MSALYYYESIVNIVPAITGAMSFLNPAQHKDVFDAGTIASQQSLGYVGSNLSVQFAYGMGDYYKKTSKYFFWFCVFFLWNFALIALRGVHPQIGPLYYLAVVLQWIPQVYVIITEYFAPSASPRDFYTDENVFLECVYTIVSDLFLLFPCAIGTWNYSLLFLMLGQYSFPAITAIVVSITLLNRLCFFTVNHYIDSYGIPYKTNLFCPHLYGQRNLNDLEKTAHDRYSGLFGFKIEKWYFFLVDAKFAYLLISTPVFVANFSYFLFSSEHRYHFLRFLSCQNTDKSDVGSVQYNIKRYVSNITVPVQSAFVFSKECIFSIIWPQGTVSGRDEVNRKIQPKAKTAYR